MLLLARLWLLFHILCGHGFCFLLFKPHLPKTVSGVSVEVHLSRSQCSSPQPSGVTCTFLLGLDPPAPLLPPPPLVLRALSYAAASCNSLQAPSSPSSQHPPHTRLLSVLPAAFGCRPHPGLYSCRSRVQKTVVRITTNLCSQPHPMQNDSVCSQLFKRRYYN